MSKAIRLLGILSMLAFGALAEVDSLPPLADGKAPQNFDEMWAGYDPTKELLETQVLKEWEQDGVVLRVIRYRIGIFKGQKAWMAAIYGFPKGGVKLPGLVQIHGGGQFADYRAPLINASRGYATISIAWAGRINAPGYEVAKKEIDLFWAGKTNDVPYKLTTDWGALDAYHAPSRNEKNQFGSVAPAAWTLDAVESPRNSSWFLCVLGARRALTFLENQPEVDAQKLGVYGHSMGGKITVMTTGADSRVKAAAPSCGGLSDRVSESPLYRATIADDQSLKRIGCPIIFLSPANDFHGRIDDQPRVLREIKSPQWRLVSAAHGNHQDLPESMGAANLWFDQHLKGNFTFPRTPEASLNLKTSNSVPLLTVKPDPTTPILAVDIYYTQQGQVDGKRNDMTNTINRFWKHAQARRNGNTWNAELPVSDTARPLWVYANVLYPLEQPVKGAGYYYEPFTAKEVSISSALSTATPDELQQAGVVATAKPSLVIEAFETNWQKEWFTYDLKRDWARRTHKIYDPRWQAPVGARLALEVRTEKPNKLVIGIDSYAAEISLNGGTQWQNIILDPSDFRDGAVATLSDWKSLKELRLGAKERLKATVDGREVFRNVGAEWKGREPEFRNLRWSLELPR